MGVLLPLPDYKYWAFISYSHQDNLPQRRNRESKSVPWAKWLHESLETYDIPIEFRPVFSECPQARFHPCFRDEDELPTNSDLAGQIHQALDRSRFLIVIASPRSAQSRYVNEEVRYFRSLGRGHRIMTLIVDGEPNVQLAPREGFTEGDECFCPALVHPLNEDGGVDVDRLLEEEVIAADVRWKKETYAREMSLAESRTEHGKSVLQFMFLKIAAGILGCGLDDLAKRQQQRELAKSLREARRFRRLAAFFGGLFLLIIGLGCLAWYMNERASIESQNARNAKQAKAIEEEKRAKAEAERAAAEKVGVDERTRRQRALVEAARTDRLAAVQKAADGEPEQALALLARALRTESQCPEPTTLSAEAAMVILGDYTRKGASLVVETEAPLEDVRWVPGGQYLVTVSRRGAVSLFEFPSGKRVADLNPPENRSELAPSFSPDGKWAALPWTSGIAIFELPSGKLHKSFATTGIISMEFRPDSKELMVVNTDGRARVWDFQKGTLLRVPAGFDLSQMNPGYGAPLLNRADVVPTYATWSPDAKMVLMCVESGGTLWDATAQEPSAPLVTLEKVPPSPIPGALDPDGDMHPVHLLRGRPPLRFSDKGDSIIGTVPSSPNLAVWKTSTGELEQQMRGHTATVTSLNVPTWRSGRSLVSASLDGTVWNWSVLNVKNRRMIGKHAGAVLFADLSPSLSLIASASEDKTVALWAGGDKILFEGHRDKVNCVRFSPDGKHLASASDDGTIRVWAVSAETFARDMEREEGQAFPPDKGLLSAERTYSVSADGSLTVSVTPGQPSALLNTKTNQRIAELPPAIQAAAFQPDNSLLYTLHEPGSPGQGATLSIYRTADGSLVKAIPRACEWFVGDITMHPAGAGFITREIESRARLWSAAGEEIATLSLPGKDAREGSERGYAYTAGGRRIVSARAIRDATDGSIIGLTKGGRDDHFRAAPDGSSLLVVWQGFSHARRYTLLPPSSERPPAWLEMLLEYVCQRRVDNAGQTFMIPASELETLEQRLRDVMKDTATTPKALVELLQYFGPK